MEEELEDVLRPPNLAHCCVFHLNQHDREYRNKVQGFSCYLFLSQQAKCTIWRVKALIHEKP